MTKSTNSNFLWQVILLSLTSCIVFLIPVDAGEKMGEFELLITTLEITY